MSRNYDNNMVLGIAGNNWVYFTSADKPEPAHAHANWPTRTEQGSAKIWVYKDGSTKIASRGKLSHKDIDKVCEFLSLNHIRLFKKWESKFGFLEIYGEPGIEFTIVSDEIVEKSKYSSSSAFADNTCSKTKSTNPGCNDNKAHYWCRLFDKTFHD